MDTENESFEKLQKLLALKRHELPPLGYFDSFSSKVMSRLRALEAARLVTWRQRLGLDFDFKPAMMGASGVVVCGLLLVGVITSRGISQTSNPEVAALGDPSAFFASPASGMTLVPILRPEEIPSSTVPVSDTAASSPFAQLTPHAQRVGFTFPSGN